ncbi:MAG: hypothetical protein JNJ75_03640 [Cyclobacteriaceae bacterium]|nr:hypothetical protein [Cyclobacteriaceae bacterium]
MNYSVTCSHCGKRDLYEKSECENIGSFASVILAVKCHHCDQYTPTAKPVKTNFPQNNEVILEYDHDSGGVVIKKKTRSVLATKERLNERAENSDIREYWIQQYFAVHYKRYGFKAIEGPFESGPDFTTSTGIGIEIERACQNYINHGHPTQGTFSNVKFLVVLSSKMVAEQRRHLLPPKIIVIDKEHFVTWFQKASKEYALTKSKQRTNQQLTLRVELIANEFYNRWFRICPNKDGDMSICPSCKGCPYEPEFDFRSWAVEFIFYYGLEIWRPDFSFSDISPQRLQKFFDTKVT